MPDWWGLVFGPVPGVWGCPVTQTVHKLSAGDGYMYLMRQVAAMDATERGYGSLEGYYSAKGETPGMWGGRGLESLGVAGQVTEQQMKNLFGLGLHPEAERLQQEAIEAGKTARQAVSASRLGQKFRVYEQENDWRERLYEAYAQWNIAGGLEPNDPIPDEAKAKIRTDLGERMFIEMHDREHADERELTSFMARMGRPQQTAVAGFDLTFTPVKSVSTLWAVAPMELASKIEAAHHKAVEYTLEMLEREIAFTRSGRNGVAQVATRGLVYTKFFHRDSRAGDPNMHTHVPVSNKIQTLDGRWLALDARMVYRFGVESSETYNLALRNILTAEIGVSWAARDMGKGKQDVWEIAGMDPELDRVFSSRRLSMEPVLAELTAQFQQAHGRLPTPAESYKLAQTANLDTRMAKHEPRSLAEQRTQWAAQAVGVLGKGGVSKMIAELPRHEGYESITDAQVSELAMRALIAVTDKRAEFRQTNLAAQVKRSMVGYNVHPELQERVIAEAVTRALSPDTTLRVEQTWVLPEVPQALQRPDGESVFRVHGAQKFTTHDILEAEQRVIAAAGRRDGKRLPLATVELTELEWSANHGGAQLNNGQKSMLRELCTNGRRINLAVAPGGTGKTTVMGLVARAHTAAGGNVVGLSPQAVPAEELAASIGQQADTLHKFIHSLHNQDPRWWPEWMKGINADSLVMVDEAGLASTRHLDDLTRFVIERGGSVVLVGDNRQRAAAAAGGVLVDIEHEHGAITLTEVVRFDDKVQGTASLALRNGDPLSLGYYLDQGWLHPVNQDNAIDQVYAGWAADIAAGNDSIMVAPTLEDVRQLNFRARADRLAGTVPTWRGRLKGLFSYQPEPGVQGRELALPNGETVSRGDTVVAKKNNRELRLSNGQWVKNGHRFRVDKVTAKGELKVTHLDTGITTVLQADYIAEGSVRLGYAHAVASVQGLTVGKPHKIAGTSHTLVREGMALNEFYVAMSRAVSQNHAYGQMQGTGADDHNLIRPQAVRPEEIIEFFTTVLGTDGSARSVTTGMREEADPKIQLGFSADGYREAITLAARALVGEQRLQQITEAAELAVPGVTDSPAWDTLLGHLATLEMCERDSIDRLTTAADMRELDTAEDLAAVMDYRLDRTGNHSLGAGPLPWLPAIPQVLRDLPDWDVYLTAAHDQILELVDLVRAEASEWTLDTAPDWAIPYLAEKALVVNLAVWRACDSVPETDLRPAGPEPRSLTLKKPYRALVKRAMKVAGNPADGQGRWEDLLGARGITVDWDDHWPVVAARLSLADKAGVPVMDLIDKAVEGSPLPTEKPAAALWWRLAKEKGFTAATQVHSHSGHQIRPVWTVQLTETLGEELTERIVADRLWPVIVSRMDQAIRDEAGDPAVLAAGAAGLFAAHAGAVHTHEAPAVLLHNLSTFIDGDQAPRHADDFEMLPQDPATADQSAPEDLYDHTPEVLVDPDQDWGWAEEEPPFEDHSEYEPAPDPLDYTDDTGHLEVPDGHVVPVPEVEDWFDPVELWTAEQTERARQDTRSALSMAADFYTGQAEESWVPGYLAGRGLDRRTAGYAPATKGNWAHLAEHLQMLGFTEETILATGLVKHNSRGNLMDVFRNRAVLPITTADGQVVSFMGRAEEGTVNERNPKYMNTANTDLFTKGKMVHGLTPEVVQALQGGADVVFVEGPMDAAAINQSRPDNLVAVSSNGTAFTAGHLEQINDIAPLTDRQVLLVLDPDTAGQAASARGYDHLAGFGITAPATVALPEGCDPAQLLQDQGPQAVRDIFTDRRPLIDAAIAHRATHVRKGETDQQAHTRQVTEVIDLMATLTVDDQIRLTETTAALLSVDPFDLMDQLTTKIAENDFNRPAAGDTGPADNGDGRPSGVAGGPDPVAAVQQMVERTTALAAKIAAGKAKRAAQQKASPTPTPPARKTPGKPDRPLRQRAGDTQKQDRARQEQARREEERRQQRYRDDERNNRGPGHER
ncbi:toprim domain-containing protein [Nakamurella silvestris]|nr:toprim domain-containing protein [Nakamurella silvestris]